MAEKDEFLHLREALELCRVGFILENFPVLQNLSHRDLPPEKVGLKPNELTNFSHQFKVLTAKQLVALCEADFVEDNAEKIERLINYHDVKFGEIGIDDEKLKAWLHQAQVIKGKKALHLCRKGFINGNAEKLQRAINNSISLTEIRCNPDELRKYCESPN